MKAFSTVIHLSALMILLVSLNLSALQRQIYFKETTFDQFAYPNGMFDEEYTAIIRERANEQFPKARTHIIKGYITNDKPRSVVEYYSKLCGQRFFKEGDHFVFVFSQIDNKPATRIEIYQAPIARIHREFWPTRVDLYIIRYPILGDIPKELNRSPEELKARLGRFYYDGQMREDIAQLDMEEFGPDAEVYVITTQDDFEQVYRFFRRRFGPFRVRPARDGDMLTRDFEIDITRAATEEDADKDIYVYVEENPIVMDRNGNSQLYRGWVFIRYFFWEKDAMYSHP